MKRIHNQGTLFNIALTVITKFIVLLGSFIVSILLARFLGPEGKGLVTAIMVVPTLLISLAELGIRQSSAYYVGRKIYSVTNVVANLTILWVGTSVISVFIVFGIFSIRYDQYEWSLLASLTIPFNLMINYSKGVLQGIQRYASINSFEIYKILFNFMLVLILIWLFDLGVLGAILVQLFIALLVAIYSLKIIAEITKFKIRFDFKLTKNLFIKGITFGLALFVLQLNYRIDIMFLEYYKRPVDIGIYSVGTNLAELIWQVPAAASLILFGKSANSKSNDEAIGRTVTLLRVILPFLVVFCILFGVFSPIIVRVLYGADFIAATSVIQLLLPGVLAMVVVKILHADLAGRGFPLYAIWVTIGPLLLNCVFNIIFIPKFGVNGAAITSSISYLLSGVLFIIVYAKKEKILIRSICLMKKEDIINFIGVFSKIQKRYFKK